MTDLYLNEPMLEMYLFETTQNLEQLEQSILESEKSNHYTKEMINEIFRIMHTIKGSSAMMLFNNISMLAHTMEDLFYFIRENNPREVDYSTLSSLILDGVDFIKVELYKIKVGEAVNGDATGLMEGIKEYLSVIKRMNPTEEEIEKPKSTKQPQYYIAQSKTETHLDYHYYRATIFFEDGCEMENIRAYTIIHNMKELARELSYHPSDIIENEDTTRIIREQGFQVFLKTEKPYQEVEAFFQKTIFLKDLELVQLENDEEIKEYRKEQLAATEGCQVKAPVLQEQREKEISTPSSGNQSIISVNVAKLDKLMDLVGEMVISEAMVIQNPDLKGLELTNFHKAARQLHKITSELQDIVMSIRMVPLANTFHKMQRIVRDMSKKLDKEVELILIGEETEVDKNIIEHISDPLMHLVRNSIDHGIETAEVRTRLGKPKAGRVYLEAKNAGSDVLIQVRDDGKGLSKDKILAKARENHLLTKPENEMTDKEIYNLIFLPGFSTKEAVSEFSGRGVGMDVVTKSIEAIGGVVSVDSAEGLGSTIKIKIPLTLAIIDGMNIQVGSSHYTIPITAIKESFRPKQTDLIRDPDGNEMIMMRGQCYSILRLHEFFHVTTEITEFTQGIFVMVEQDEKRFCIFADRLIGQQQVVVKALPQYISNSCKKQGLAGCTLLGDGNISLILDIAGLSNI